MREILNLNIILDQTYEVKGNKKDVCMILFHGQAHSDYFNGIVLPGGVDTQIYDKKCERTLSARYILKGKDANQDDCHIFIENFAKVEEGNNKIITKPSIVTDSKTLKWMEEADLIGSVQGEDNCIRILICERED